MASLLSQEENLLRSSTHFRRVWRVHILRTSIRRLQGVMSSYRFYSHDHLGRLVDRRERQCRDDADALTVARSLNHAHDIAIWLGPRRVARIPKRSKRMETGADCASDDTAPSSALDRVGRE